MRRGVISPISGWDFRYPLFYYGGPHPGLEKGFHTLKPLHFFRVWIRNFDRRPKGFIDSRDDKG